MLYFFWPEWLLQMAMTCPRILVQFTSRPARQCFEEILFITHWTSLFALSTEPWSCGVLGWQVTIKQFGLFCCMRSTTNFAINSFPLSVLEMVQQMTYIKMLSHPKSESFYNASCYIPVWKMWGYPTKPKYFSSLFATNTSVFFGSTARYARPIEWSLMVIIQHCITPYTLLFHMVLM